MKNPNTKHIVIFSVADALADLHQKGYIHKFRREPTCLYCIELYLWVVPEQFSVDASYYFEEVSSPDGDRVVYAISTSSGIKGFLVDTYGVYADNMSSEMSQKLGLNKNKMRQINASENRKMNVYNRRRIRKKTIDIAYAQKMS